MKITSKILKSVFCMIFLCIQTLPMDAIFAEEVYFSWLNKDIASRCSSDHLFNTTINKNRQRAIQDKIDLKNAIESRKGKRTNLDVHKEVNNLEELPYVPKDMLSQRLRYEHLAKGESNTLSRLDDLIKLLHGMRDKTEFETSILNAARALMRNYQERYINEEAMEEFEQVVRILNVAKEIDLLEQADFRAIINLMNIFAQEKEKLYKEYITKTKETYKNLEILLGVDIDKQNELLESFIAIPSMTIDVKRAITINIALDRLQQRKADTLTDTEKEALQIDKKELKQEKDKYINSIQEAICNLITGIRSFLQDKGQVLTTTTKEDARMIIMLPRKQ